MLLVVELESFEGVLVPEHLISQESRKNHLRTVEMNSLLKYYLKLFLL